MPVPDHFFSRQKAYSPKGHVVSLGENKNPYNPLGALLKSLPNGDGHVTTQKPF